MKQGNPEPPPRESTATGRVSTTTRPVPSAGGRLRRVGGPEPPIARTPGTRRRAGSPTPRRAGAPRSTRHGDLPAPLVGRPGDREPPARTNGHRVERRAPPGRRQRRPTIPASHHPRRPPHAGERTAGAARRGSAPRRPATGSWCPPNVPHRRQEQGAGEPDRGPAPHAPPSIRPPRTALAGPSPACPPPAPPAVQVPPVGTAASGFEVPPGFHAPTSERLAADDIRPRRGTGGTRSHPSSRQRPAAHRGRPGTPTPAEPQRAPDTSRPVRNAPGRGVVGHRARLVGAELEPPELGRRVGSALVPPGRRAGRPCGTGRARAGLGRRAPPAVRAGARRVAPPVRAGARRSAPRVRVTGLVRVRVRARRPTEPTARRRPNAVGRAARTGRAGPSRPGRRDRSRAWVRRRQWSTGRPSVLGRWSGADQRTAGRPSVLGRVRCGPRLDRPSWAGGSDPTPTSVGAGAAVLGRGSRVRPRPVRRRRGRPGPAGPTRRRQVPRRYGRPGPAGPRRRQACRRYARPGPAGPNRPRPARRPGGRPGPAGADPTPASAPPTRPSWASESAPADPPAWPSRHLRHRRPPPARRATSHADRRAAGSGGPAAGGGAPVLGRRFADGEQFPGRAAGLVRGPAPRRPGRAPVLAGQPVDQRRLAAARRASSAGPGPTSGRPHRSGSGRRHPSPVRRPSSRRIGRAGQRPADRPTPPRPPSQRSRPPPRRVPAAAISPHRRPPRPTRRADPPPTRRRRPSRHDGGSRPRARWCCRSASPRNRTCPSCRSRQPWSHPPKPRNSPASPPTCAGTTSQPHCGSAPRGSTSTPSWTPSGRWPVSGTRPCAVPPAGAHSLRLDLADGADPAEVSRQVARLLQERMGLAAAPQNVPGLPSTPPPPVRRRAAEPRRAAYPGDSTRGFARSRRGPGGRVADGRPSARRSGRGRAGRPGAVDRHGPDAPPPVERSAPGSRHRGGTRVGLGRAGRRRDRQPGDARHVVLRWSGDHDGVGAVPAAGHRRRAGAPGGDRPRAGQHVRPGRERGGPAAGRGRQRLRVRHRPGGGRLRAAALRGGGGRRGGRVAARRRERRAGPLLRRARGGRCRSATARWPPWWCCWSASGWVEQLAGSALVAGDPRQAVVRATLAAVNRRLEALLS